MKRQKFVKMHQKIMKNNFFKRPCYTMWQYKSYNNSYEAKKLSLFFHKLKIIGFKIDIADIIKENLCITCN